jgi:PIN domain nuclease of toxin-antitoxin system
MDSEECFYSIASLWEIAIKQSLGKLEGVFSVSDIDSRCRQAGFLSLQILPMHLERIPMLPDVHRDPFDRLLVAQAQEEGLSIITSDRFIPQYPVHTIW